MSISIRPAVPGDWQAIQFLNNAVFQNDKDNDPELNLEWPYSEAGASYYQKLANGKEGYCLVAELEGKVVGYIALSEREFDYRTGKYIEVNNTGVHPEYRSSGIGTQLMTAAAEWAKQQGATRLYVEAYFGNQRGVQFYKKNGFVEIGIQLEKEL